MNGTNPYAYRNYSPNRYAFRNYAPNYRYRPRNTVTNTNKPSKEDSNKNINKSK